MASKTDKLILYLNRNRFDLYRENVADPLSLQVPGTALRDLDVVDSEQFKTVITSFVKSNQIVASRVLVILAPSVVFEKVLEVEEVQERDRLHESFISKVPFEDLTVRSYKAEKGERVIAVNRRLCSAVQDAFESLDFSVEAFVAMSVIDEIPTGEKALTSENVRGLFRKFSSLKQKGLVISYGPTLEEGADSMSFTQHAVPGKRRLFVLIGVFIVLVGILVFLLIHGA